MRTLNHNSSNAFTLITFFLLLAVAVSANDKLMQVLRHKGIISEEEYQRLKMDSSSKLQVKYDNGVVVASKDGKFEMTIGGRLMLDAAWFDDDLRDLGDGTEVRRARIDIAGAIFENWEFEAQYDFSDDEVSAKDLWIAYVGFNRVELKLGQFKEPFSLEELTSSKYITFMERALPNVFAPGRNIGIGIHGGWKNHSLAAGFFGQSAGDDPDDDEGYGASARFTIAPMNEDGRVLHLGIAGAYRTPDDENRDVRFRQRPEAHKAIERLVNTGNIQEVNYFTRIGVEAAVVFGPFSVQGEWIQTEVDRGRESRDLDFNGAYIYGSWFITGESRNYKGKSGKFSRVRPIANAGSHGGIGAWEVAVRYSELDLDDNDITGGDEDNVTFGLNWYLNPQLRFMANYIVVDSEQAGVDDDPRIFQLRAQIDF